MPSPDPPTASAVHEVATVRLYGDLRELAGGAVHRPAAQRRSVKDLIESLGVPHTEVGLLLVEGEPVGLEAVVSGPERVAAYPRLGRLPTPGPRLHPEPPTPARFVLDVHLGRLARRLRTLGLDARYRNDRDDDALAALAVDEQRILLTRDRGLLMRREVVHGQLIRDDDAEEQAMEVLWRHPVDLAPFTRCVNCNGRLEGVAREAVLDRLPPRTRVEHSEFVQCRRCGQVFWPGSHREHLESFVVRAEAEVELARYARSARGEQAVRRPRRRSRSE